MRNIYDVSLECHIIYLSALSTAKGYTALMIHKLTTGGMIMTGNNGSTQRRTCPIANFSTTHPTLTGLGCPYCENIFQIQIILFSIASEFVWDSKYLLLYRPFQIICGAGVSTQHLILEKHFCREMSYLTTKCLIQRKLSCSMWVFRFCSDVANDSILLVRDTVSLGNWFPV